MAQDWLEKITAFFGICVYMDSPIVIVVLQDSGIIG